MESMIRDISLAPSGRDKINWVKNFMPVMEAVNKEFSISKPFAGKKMVITLHFGGKDCLSGDDLQKCWCRSRYHRQ